MAAEGPMTRLRMNPHLLKVPLYIAGKSIEEVQEEFGLDDVVKMASNENPLGPSPRAIEALVRTLPDAHRYPGAADRALRRRLGPRSHPSFDERHVITGNGATDLIRSIVQAFIFDGGEVVTGHLTFPMYAICTQMFGGALTEVPPRSDFGLDLAAMAQAITPNTRLVFVSTPNNPTGMICRRLEVSAFMNSLPEGVVAVFDESYREFVSDADYPDPTEYIAQGRDVIVLRSFSKAAGLANLRVGYAISTPEIIHYLLHAQLPFNTGAPALAAALASLDDRDYVVRSRKLVEEQRAFLYERLDALDVRYVPSHTNFILLTDLPMDANAFSELLIRQGVIVRPMNAWGLDRAVRVSVGHREDNEKYLGAMQVVLEGVRARSPVA